MKKIPYDSDEDASLFDASPSPMAGAKANLLDQKLPA